MITCYATFDILAVHYACFFGTVCLLLCSALRLGYGRGSLVGGGLGWMAREGIVDENDTCFSLSRENDSDRGSLIISIASIAWPPA